MRGAEKTSLLSALRPLCHQRPVRLFSLRGAVTKRSVKSTSPRLGDPVLQLFDVRSLTLHFTLDTTADPPGPARDIPAPSPTVPTAGAASWRNRKPAAPSRTSTRNPTSSLLLMRLQTVVDCQTCSMSSPAFFKISATRLSAGVGALPPGALERDRRQVSESALNFAETASREVAHRLTDSLDDLIEDIAVLLEYFSPSGVI